MIQQTIRAVCALSVLCGAAETLCPEGTTRTVLKIVCACAVAVTLLSGIREIDYGEYAPDMAKVRDMSEELVQRAGEKADALDRLVIASECEAYIRDKAADRSLTVSELTISLVWDREGCWVPYSLTGVVDGDPAPLRGIAEAELGIPTERQEWRRINDPNESG